MAACYDIVTAAENWVTVVARIGMLRELNRHVERVFDPSRKGALYQGRDMGTVEAALASGLETARTLLG